MKWVWEQMNQWKWYGSWVIITWISDKNGSKVVRERIVDKNNRKWMTNDDDQIVWGQGLRVPKRNPADVHGPWDECRSCWLVGVKWLLGFQGWGRVLINLLYPFHQQLTSLPILLPCLVPIFVLLCLSSSFLVILLGRQLLLGIVASSLVLGLIVWLPTPQILRCWQS